MSTPRVIATSFTERGWAPVPVPHQCKAPTVTGWQKLRIGTPGEVNMYFNGKPQNIGVLLGEPSGWLVDVDLDHPEAVALARDYLPPTEARFGRSGKRESHYLYRVTAPIQTVKHQTVNPTNGAKTMLVELRSTGCQTVFPGSVHESGELVDWEAHGQPAEIDPDTLAEAVRLLAEDVAEQIGEPLKGGADQRRTLSVPVKQMPAGDADRAWRYILKTPESVAGQGGDDALFRAACECYRFGLSDADARQIMDRFNAEKCSPPWAESRIKYKLDEAKETVEREGQFGSRLRESICTNRTDAPAPAPVADGQFADFTPLTSTTTPPLPVDAIPEPMRSLIVHKAESTEAPPELSFVAALGSVAAVVQTRFAVRVRDDYIEQLSIYAAGVAQPGERKTAQINEGTAPLIRWEIDERQRVAEENEAIAIERQVVEGRMKEVQKQATKTSDSMERKRLVDEARELQEEMPELQEPRRLFADDATPEQLAMLMGRNAGAMAIITDEGGAFLSGLAGRYAAGVAHIDAVLKGWSGSPVRIDRANGRNVLLDRSYCSMALMIQHELAAKMGENRDFLGRGLLDRFIWLMPGSRLGYRTHQAKPMPEHVSRAWCDAVAALLAIPPAPKRDDAEATEPHKINLSPDAMQVWLDYAREVETYMRPGHQYYHLRQYCGKWPGQTARLAGVFHCIEHAHQPTGRMPHDVPMSQQTMSNAVEVCRVLLDHADAAFFTMRRNDRIDRALRLWEWVKRHDADTFTGREAWQSVKRQSAFPDADAMRDGFRVLLEYGYVSLTREGKSEVYTVNPEARAHDAA